MMRFKDYPIKITKPETFMASEKTENVDETLMRINEWVEMNEHIVLNIETLFFPNLSFSNKGTGAAYYTTGDAGFPTVFQVFRVWYKESIQDLSTQNDNLV